MKRGSSVRLPLTLATLSALALPVAAQDNWSFDVAPYLVASFGAETSLPPNGPHPGVRELSTHISGGFMIAAQARYRSAISGSRRPLCICSLEQGWEALRRQQLPFSISPLPPYRERLRSAPSSPISAGRVAGLGESL